MSKVIKRVTARVLAIGMIGSTLLGFTGCGDKRIEAFLQTDLINVMTSRINANKAIANKLFVSGLISDSEKKKIEENIDNQMGAYISGNIANNDELQSRLLASIVDWSAPEWEDYGPISTVSDGKNGTKSVNSLNYTKEDWNNTMVTTYIKNKGYASHFDIPLFKGKESLIKPISIIDGETGELINKRFGYKVYVLKPFSSEENKGAINGQKSLDEVLEMVNAATSDKNKIDNSVLDQLFKKAVDENGKDVTLLDIAKRINETVVDSNGSPLVTDSKFEVQKGELKQTVVGNKVKESVDVNRKEFTTPTNESAPGKDMVIKDKTEKVPLMAIRFHEFNSEAVDNIIKTLGMSPDKYLFTTYGGENRVYIMEYPVHYVSEMRDKKGDANSYESVFAKSNMGINIRMGKLVKYGSAWGTDTDEGVYFESSDPYLSVKGAKNAQVEGKSAFIIEGETPKDAAMEIGENKSKVQTGRIVLRDYLEATYAPQVVSGENIVIFGRKIRILQFSGSKNNVVGKYYDKEGTLIPNSVSLMIDDFADFEALNSSDPSIKYIGRVGEAITKTDTKNDNTKKEGVYQNDGIKSSLSKIDNLKTSVVAKISPVEQFPGTKIGKVDNTKSNKPLFYAMTVKKNMFDTALFSGWINNKDATKNSMDWWQAWLSNTNRAYQYRINKTSLEEYLTGNYTFELQENGIVIIDLETISKIQKEYEQQEKDNTVIWFRTTFVVLGWAVLVYSMILLLAWIVDTNIDFGFRLLEKLTFGHWIAVKDMENVPYADLAGRKYVTFRSLIFKVLGIAVVGVILILINVIDVVVYLIDIFGGIAKTIGRLITGA